MPIAPHPPHQQSDSAMIFEAGANFRSIFGRP